MKCLIGNAIWLLTVNVCATEIPPVLIPTNIVTNRPHGIFLAKDVDILTRDHNN